MDVFDDTQAGHLDSQDYASCGESANQYVDIPHSMSLTSRCNCQTAAGSSSWTSGTRPHRAFEEHVSSVHKQFAGRVTAESVKQTMHMLSECPASASIASLAKRCTCRQSLQAAKPRSRGPTLQPIKHCYQDWRHLCGQKQQLTCPSNCSS